MKKFMLSAAIVAMAISTVGYAASQYAPVEAAGQGYLSGDISVAIAWPIVPGHKVRISGSGDFASTQGLCVVADFFGNTSQLLRLGGPSGWFIDYTGRNNTAALALCLKESGVSDQFAMVAVHIGGPAPRSAAGKSREPNDTATMGEAVQGSSDVSGKSAEPIDPVKEKVLYEKLLNRVDELLNRSQ